MTPEDFARRRRAHDEQILAALARKLDEKLVPEHLHREVLARVKAMLDTESEHAVSEVGALIARGWRVDEPVH